MLKITFVCRNFPFQQGDVTTLHRITCGYFAYVELQIPHPQQGPPPIIYKNFILLSRQLTTLEGLDFSKCRNVVVSKLQSNCG